jgi:SAM-dependent methyltransferase
MNYIDFLSPLHKSTKRDYLARVNDIDFPKYKAADLAKKWDFDYWDGDRRINYGGYKYIEGRWEKVAKLMIDQYGLKNGDKILDIGCGKGYLMFDFKKILPDIEIYGVDISDYAVMNSKPEIKNHIQVANANNLPFEDDFFDFTYSLNTFHNLHCYDLEKALYEMNRVSKKNKYICVESYRNELEKMNLLYWQVTCEMFCTPDEWIWWFNSNNYDGDYSFIYFE